MKKMKLFLRRKMRKSVFTRRSGMPMIFPVEPAVSKGFTTPTCKSRSSEWNRVASKKIMKFQYIPVHFPVYFSNSSIGQKPNSSIFKYYFRFWYLGQLYPYQT